VWCTLQKWERTIKISSKEIGVRVWTEFNWLRNGPVAGCCEDGKELLGLTKAGT